MAGRSFRPRQATLCNLHRPGTDEKLDQALVLWFPGPKSFTGEDVAEFQIHGGPAVIQSVLGAVTSLQGCRLAEAGEFTRRAFLNGRLDLTEVEGLADLIQAETEAQRAQALRQMSGALAKRIESWREALIRQMAHLEATIDFAEEDIPEDLIDNAFRALGGLRAEIEGALAESATGVAIRDGYRIAILGAPNVGKSSLLNRLAGREAAIVTDRAGTTRDVVEVHLTLGGQAVILADTAGLRETADVVEAEGIRRTGLTAEEADLRIAVVEAGQPMDSTTSALVRDGDLIVANKIDQWPLAVAAGQLPLSARSGDGVERLLVALEEKVGLSVGLTEEAGVTRERHRQALAAVVDHLHRAEAEREAGSELVAEQVRLAARELGRITGRIDVEDLLDVVFRDFCIGK